MSPLVIGATQARPEHPMTSSARIGARPDPDANTIAFEVILEVAPTTVPRLAVRSPAGGGAVDVVNVEDAGTAKAVDGSIRRSVRFIVEAEKVTTPWTVKLIVDDGSGEITMAGPEVPAR